MLVLSRKETQSISFAGLGITVQILRVRGGNVRVGVEAPLEVRIVRNELLENEEPPAAPTTFTMPPEQRHQFLNQLNAISIGLHLYEQELAAGNRDRADQALASVKTRLATIVGDPNAVFSPVLPVAEPAEKSSSLSALVVEDQPNEREMLAGVLRMHGYSVATASDGLEAINYLEKEVRPSVVLIDMRMPRCDGPMTVQRIRQGKTHADVPIFAISGSTPEEENMLVSEAGDVGNRVNRWFMKPLDPVQLIAAMRGSGGPL